MLTKLTVLGHPSPRQPILCWWRR